MKKTPKADHAEAPLKDYAKELREWVLSTGGKVTELIPTMDEIIDVLSGKVHPGNYIAYAKSPMKFTSSSLLEGQMNRELRHDNSSTDLGIQVRVPGRRPVNHFGYLENLEILRLALVETIQMTH